MTIMTTRTTTIIITPTSSATRLLATSISICGSIHRSFAVLFPPFEMRSRTRAQAEAPSTTR